MTVATFSPVGLRFENIDKRYGGLLALRGVSLTIAAGECVVFAGRNGSGKTTLLRIAARLVRPSRGELSFTAAPSSEENNPIRPGFVAHATMVYDELTAEENLLLFARLLGTAQPENRVEALLQEVGLSDRRASRVRTFSRGECANAWRSLALCCMSLPSFCSTSRQLVSIRRALLGLPKRFAGFATQAAPF